MSPTGPIRVLTVTDIKASGRRCPTAGATSSKLGGCEFEALCGHLISHVMRTCGEKKPRKGK